MHHRLPACTSSFCHHPIAFFSQILIKQFVHNSEVFINDPLRVTHGDFEMPPMECPQSSATCGAQSSRAKRGPAARSAAAAEGGRRRKAPGSRRRPPSFARVSDKARMRINCRDQAAAYKLPWSAGKRALHERDSWVHVCIGSCGHCIGSLCGFIVLIPCIGSLYWFIVLVHCIGSLY